MLATPSQNASPQTPVEGPWLGLESYREQDAGRFFGREKETEELLRMVRREVLTIVFGPSGIGKTSLLRAGLFGRLAQEDHFPIYIRPTYREGAPPIEEQVRDCVRQALEERAIDEELPPESGTTLWEYLHAAEFWSGNNRILTPVLFLDQFEEVFTHGEGLAGAAKFLKELAEIIENYLPESVAKKYEATGVKIPAAYRRQTYKVVITLREDFVHRLDALRKSMPSIMQNRYPLAQLNGRQALDAVAKPGKGIVSDAVAEQIVRFAATGTRAPEGVSDLEELRVEPALLSVVCQELYSRAVADGKREITAVAVDAAATDILDDFYERSFEGLSPQARVFVEDRLLTASGFRNTAPLEDATAAGVDAPTVSTLVERRLIRVERRLGIPHLELTHDLLAKVVLTNRKARQERERRLASESERAAQAQSLARARRIGLVLGLATLISLALGAVAIYAWGKALQSTAEANRLRDQARSAEQRAQAAEYIAYCNRAIESLENEVIVARQKGELGWGGGGGGGGADNHTVEEKERQLAEMQKRLDDFKTGRWTGPASKQVSPSAILSSTPPAEKRAVEARLMPDKVLSNYNVNPSKFVSGYGTAFKPLSAVEAAAVTGLVKLIDDDPAVPDIRWAAYILATIRWETGLSWRTDSEKGPPETFAARYGPGTYLGARLWNTEPDDAFRYRGRGFVFLTGKANYARYGKLLGMGTQLVDKPELMLDPTVAYRVTSQGMIKGWFSDRKLADFISGDAADYLNARRIINGLDHALDVSQAAGKLEQVLAGSLESAKVKGR